MTKRVAATGVRIAAVLWGAMIAASCGNDNSAGTTVKAPPGVKGPTTQEVLAQRALSQPAPKLADLEAIADLGQPVAAEGPDGKTWQKYPSGLMIVEQKTGAGASPKLGQTVAVSYVGTIPKDGKEFDRSPDGQPLKFILGTKNIIKGWNMVVSTMNVGAKRRVWIPADLAYGARGSRPKIGPNQPLIFEMELVSITGDPVKLPESGPQPATGPATVPSTGPAATSPDPH